MHVESGGDLPVVHTQEEAQRKSSLCGRDIESKQSNFHETASQIGQGLVKNPPNLESHPLPLTAAKKPPPPPPQSAKPTLKPRPEAKSTQPPPIPDRAAKPPLKERPGMKLAEHSQRATVSVTKEAGKFEALSSKILSLFQKNSDSESKINRANSLMEMPVTSNIVIGTRGSIKPEVKPESKLDLSLSKFLNDLGRIIRTDRAKLRAAKRDQALASKVVKGADAKLKELQKKISELENSKNSNLEEKKKALNNLKNIHATLIKQRNDAKQSINDLQFKINNFNSTIKTNQNIYKEMQLNGKKLMSKVSTKELKDGQTAITNYIKEGRQKVADFAKIADLLVKDNTTANSSLQKELLQLLSKKVQDSENLYKACEDKIPQAGLWGYLKSYQLKMMNNQLTDELELVNLPTAGDMQRLVTTPAKAVFDALLPEVVERFHKDVIQDMVKELGLKKPIDDASHENNLPIFEKAVGDHDKAVQLNNFYRELQGNYTSRSSKSIEYIKTAEKFSKLWHSANAESA